jgi:hypothetical protein
MARAAFPSPLLELNLIPNLSSLTFELNYYYMERITEQHNLIAEIAEAVKLLSAPGNALRSFEMLIQFDYPAESDLTTRHRTRIPHRWFEQWLKLDNVLSSPNFKPVVDAVVVLDYDGIQFPRRPIPENPKEALQVLSELKALRILR